jgi:predicted sulfurtransferase
MGDPTETREKRDAFFKPTLGCACVFGGAPASVRITSEITPMGVTGYVPREWEKVKRLSPEEFHALCWGEDGSEEKGRDGKMVLLDVRNHYESRIGYFVDPRTGKKAVRPEIRRFAQWPGFVRRWVEDGVGDVQSSVKDGNANENQDQNEDGKREATENGKSRRKIMAYCTGGIRCEKATRWMVENASMKPGDEVYTLEGGIQAYLTWMAGEIRAGRKSPKDSLFKGRNYVFDARGSLGFGLDVADEMETEPVAACHICGKPEDRLSKCRSRGCHLVLVVCKKCEDGDVRCCGNCRELDTESMRDGPRPICLCEMERETKLWGEGYFKKTKVKGKRKGKEKTDDGISIQVKTIAN